MGNIIQDAKYRIYNSEAMLYVNPEKIEETFSKIHVYKDMNEFLNVLGHSTNYEIIEGFNRNNENYLSPKATTHTAIHEALHGLSSEFDVNGHRTKNGIMGDGSLRFANQVNEGLTDYLAYKLSGEPPRSMQFIQGHKLFSKLEPMMEKYTENSSILWQVYLTNDVEFVHDFLNYFGKDNIFENLYENFLFMDDAKIDNMLGKVEKNLNKYIKKRERKEKINNFFNNVKNIFNRNSKKQKLLTNGNEHYYEGLNNNVKTNFHQEFVNQYSINNFETEMTKEDIGKYKEYQQKNVKENQLQSEIEIYEE